MNNMDCADESVKKIVDDIEDRRGLRQEWEAIDSETKEEIKREWAKFIRQSHVFTPINGQEATNGLT